MNYRQIVKVLLIPTLFLGGCSSLTSVRQQKNITASEAFEVLDSAFQSCSFNGEMKYTVSEKTIGQPVLTETSSGVEFAQNTETDTFNRRSVNLVLDDILYSRIVDIDRQNNTTEIILYRSEPDCYYRITGYTEGAAESGFEGLTWTIDEASKVIRTSERMDPNILLKQVGFDLVSELGIYDDETGLYVGCNGVDYSWSRADEDGIVVISAKGQPSESLDALFLDNYPDVDQIAESFDVTESTYTITINEDEQLLTIEYSTSADYVVDGEKYDLTNSGNINFLAYSNRIPSYGTINKLISDLSFSDTTLKPTQTVKTFVY